MSIQVERLVPVKLSHLDDPSILQSAQESLMRILVPELLGKSFGSRSEMKVQLENDRGLLLEEVSLKERLKELNLSSVEDGFDTLFLWVEVMGGWTPLVHIIISELSGKTKK